MQAYEEMHEGGSWWIIASHPAHARHETQESGSFTLSRLRSRTPKALRLTALYHQSEHSRGTTSFPLPFPPLDLVLEQPLRCVFQKLISAVAEPEAVRFAAEGQRCSGGRDGIPSLLPLPLRPLCGRAERSSGFQTPLSSGQGVGVSDPVLALKRQDPRVSLLAQSGNQFQEKLQNVLLPPRYHPLSTIPLGGFYPMRSPIQGHLPPALSFP